MFCGFGFPPRSFQNFTFIKEIRLLLIILLFLMMMEPYYSNYMDTLSDIFKKLEVSNRRRSRRNRSYDELYFPQGEKVKCYVNKSPDRSFWLRHPKEPIPPQWYIKLIPGTNQFNKVVRPIKKSIGNNCKILEVEKVSNKYLERQYSLKKEEKMEYAPCEEYIMYHFTVKRNVHSIVLTNFNWRFSGSSRGHKYGYGISFSPDPAFAEQFCKSKVKTLIVAKVLVTDSQIGEPDWELPDDGFDTTRSPKKTVYVKFEDSEFYPEYIVTYSKYR